MRFEAVKALNAALAAAQGEFTAIAREKQVKVETRTGGTYEFSYAPLDAILTAVRPVLSRHGLSVTQRLEDVGGRPGLRTELRHAEGGVLGASFPLATVPESPQQLGSLLTYLRRYALVALLGVATEDDDDGNTASGNTVKAKVISKAQRGRLFAIADEKNVPEAEVRRIVKEVTGEESTTAIPVDRYEEIVELIEAAAVPF